MKMKNTAFFLFLLLTMSCVTTPDEEVINAALCESETTELGSEINFFLDQAFPEDFIVAINDQALSFCDEERSFSCLYSFEWLGNSLKTKVWLDEATLQNLFSVKLYKDNDTQDVVVEKDNPLIKFINIDRVIPTCEEDQKISINISNEV